MADKFLHLETTLNHLSDILLTTHENPLIHHPHDRHENEPLIVLSKSAKLKFSHFAGDDHIEWFSRIQQFFNFQNTLKTQKVESASYHLERETNQWWQLI